MLHSSNPRRQDIDPLFNSPHLLLASLCQAARGSPCSASAVCAPQRRLAWRRKHGGNASIVIVAVCWDFTLKLGSRRAASWLPSLWIAELALSHLHWESARVVRQQPGWSGSVEGTSRPQGSCRTGGQFETSASCSLKRKDQEFGETFIFLFRHLTDQKK